MHTTHAYPLSPQLYVAAPPRAGVFAYARGLALSFWLFTMLFRLWWVSDWFALQELFQAGFNVKEYFYYGFGVMLLTHLTLGPQAWIAAPFNLLSDWTGRLITIFFFLMLCLAPLSINPRNSAKYAIATWLVVILMQLFWTSNYRVLQRMLVLAGMVLFAWLLVLRLKHGLVGGFAGQIGGINRNVTSTAALAAMIFMLYSPKAALRGVAFLAAAFFIVSVTSRGSILALGVFVGAYYALHKGTMKAVGHAALAFALFAAAVLVAPFLRELVLEDIFRLSSKDRGIGSGFSGRFEMWEQALENFWKNPVFGHGFRTTSQGGGGDFGGIHSAYIKILLEGGFVGAFFIVGAAVIELLRRLKLSIRLRDVTPQEMPGIDVTESFRVNAISCASLCSLLTLWIYDQYYINLGSPISIAFFMVLIAPTFITSQGVTLRKPELEARQLAMMGGVAR